MLLAGSKEEAIHKRELLNAESAKSMIVNSFPEFRGVGVELLDEGWDFRVFEVGETWLFRFPKRETSVAKLNMEHRLLSGLAEWLPQPVPNYEYFCESHGGLKRPFGGYRKLPGVGGDTAAMVDRPKVARELGAFLARLHMYPAGLARNAGVPEVQDLVAYWRGKALGQLQALDGLPVNPDLLRRYLESEIPAPFEGPASLVHSDLWALHILIDSQSGRVSGIIDWADAIVGDPAIDFACLCTWYGESWLESVLANYSGDLDAGIIPRSQYLATCLAIHCITLGRDLGRGQWIEDGYAALQFIHDI